MVVWQGITEGGTAVPVQITEEGKVVAIGEAGPEGPRGPQGPEGPPGVAEWPPNPIEGAFLVWMNGEPTWYSETPVPIPPGLSPLITDVTDNSILTFNSDLDTEAFFSGVNVSAALADGTNWTNNGMYKTNREWSSGNIIEGAFAPGSPLSDIFDGDTTTYAYPADAKVTYDFVDTVPVQSKLRMYISISRAWTNFEINGRPVSTSVGGDQWYDFTDDLDIKSGEGLKSFSLGYISGEYAQAMASIEIDGAMLLDPGTGPYPRGQIATAVGNTALLSRVGGNWEAGLYMKSSAATMAAWMVTKNKRNSR